ncbi:MAG: hypothetical protein WD250_03475 [Egibacteraceae bacterium]
MPATTDSESAVRNYLLALKEPTALRDDNLVGELRQRLESTDDQLERVQLRQQVRDAENPSIERFEDEFVTHAKEWAEAHGVGASAFAEEGVPDAVLRRAGLLRGRGRGRSGRKSGGARSPRVSAADVRAAIPRGTFTIKQLQERTGGSVATVRNVVKEAEQQGLIEPQGSDPDHVGPGRAPTLYKRSKK